MMSLLGGGMSGGAALTLGGGGRKGGGGMFGGIGPGGKKVGILAGVGSASDCSAITCTTKDRGVVMTKYTQTSFKSKQNNSFDSERQSCVCVPGYCCPPDCVCVALQPC